MKKCAYCRVSTNKEEQEQSYEAQRKYYKDKGITDIYADRGLTGTSIKRESFIKMLNDCGLDVKTIKTAKRDKLVTIQTNKQSKYEYIYCKSISRFSRDIAGAIDVIRTLKSKGVYCFFEQENVDTKDERSDLLMNVMLSISQQESKNTSERIKWGAKRTAEAGVTRSVTLYGYNYDAINKSLSAIPIEAEVIKMCYELRLEGLGYRRIMNRLDELNIKTRNGAKFSMTTVKAILTNKTYCGYTRRNVRTSEGFGDDKVRKSSTKDEIIYVKNDKVEQIIDEGTFEEVQEAIKNASVEAGNHGKYMGKTDMSSKIRCVKCGKAYVKVGKNWICTSKKKNGKKACDATNIKHDEVEKLITEQYSNFYKKSIDGINIVLKLFDKLIYESNLLKSDDNIKKIEYNTELIKEHKRKIDSLLDFALTGAGAEVVKDKINSINTEILSLEEANELLVDSEKVIDDFINRINLTKALINKYINELPKTISREDYIRDYLENIKLIEYPKLYEGEKLVLTDSTMKWIEAFTTLSDEYKKIKGTTRY